MSMSINPRVTGVFSPGAFHRAMHAGPFRSRLTDLPLRAAREPGGHGLAWEKIDQKMMILRWIYIYIDIVFNHIQSW